VLQCVIVCCSLLQCELRITLSVLHTKSTTWSKRYVKSITSCHISSFKRSHVFLQKSLDFFQNSPGCLQQSPLWIFSLCNFMIIMLSTIYPLWIISTHTHTHIHTQSNCIICVQACNAVKYLNSHICKIYACTYICIYIYTYNVN